MAAEKVLLPRDLEEATTVERARAISLPPATNLFARQNAALIEVIDQGIYGSCTACAMSIAWQLMRNRMNPAGNHARPSVAFMYAESRLLLGDNLRHDGGSTNQATVQSLASRGILQELSYPYISTNIYRIPPQAVRTEAKKTLWSGATAVSYARNQIDTLNRFKAQLAAGKCIVCSILVFSSFVTPIALQGDIPMPRPQERLLGGHAIALTGYNDARRRFMFRNSWGTRYGINGMFTIPYDYITNPSLAGDCWAL